MSDRFLLYGANGYTGSLIAHYCVQRGLRPILAGRNSSQLETLALSLGLEYKAFALEDAAAVDAALVDVAAVLHCAGPFSSTSKPMVEACLTPSRVYGADLILEIEGVVRSDITG